MENIEMKVLLRGWGDLICGLKRDADLQWVADLRSERTQGRGRRVLVEEQNDAVLWVFFFKKKI